MTSTRLELPLIGRDRQLDRIQRWVDELAAGRGRAVLIEGEPGIGKSSLIRPAAADAEAAGCQVFSAACDELGQAFPLLPLLDGIDAPATVAGRRHAGIARMLRADSALGNRVDLVAAATERLLALVDELCAVAPVMLVVDDLQWADPATVLTVGRLARSVRQLPLLVVGMSRAIPRRDDLGALRRAVEPGDLLRLHRLPDKAVTEFVARAVGGDPGARLRRLAAGAAGNPLYLTELVDALKRSQALAEADGSWRSPAAGRRVRCRRLSRTGWSSSRHRCGGCCGPRRCSASISQ